MSRRYLILARVGAKLQFLSLTTNADPGTLRSTGTRMLKVWRRPEAVEILLLSDLPPHSLSAAGEKGAASGDLISLFFGER
ncbi:MAG: hypothetical protein HYX74_09110 [Acidobacteria bacterium]|nr:hypothetical protein [Acidobacteriota bacterium]